MHEGHPLYRIETSARWDLRPNNGATLPHRSTVQPASVSANDAVLAEVNKQRAATRAFTEQTAALNQRLTELGHAVEQTQEVAKQNLELKRDVATLREQLDSLDTKLHERKAPTASPLPSPEDKW
jgi:predicted RNase H-like nuclease (RuvC/YqgF family)